MSKIKIQAEGKNCQAAYNISNYGVSRVHLRDLCDWVMIGSGVVLILSEVLLFMVMHDFWGSLLCLILFGFGMFLFFLAFFPYLYLEYGLKKID